MLSIVKNQDTTQVETAYEYDSDVENEPTPNQRANYIDNFSGRFKIYQKLTDHFLTDIITAQRKIVIRECHSTLILLLSLFFCSHQRVRWHTHQNIIVQYIILFEININIK